MSAKFRSYTSITTIFILAFVLLIALGTWKSNFSDDLDELRHQNRELLELLRSINDTLVDLADLIGEIQSEISNPGNSARSNNQDEDSITELSDFVENPSNLPDLMNFPLDIRLKEEFSLLIDEYYVSFLKDIGVDQITIDNIVLELTEEYSRYQDNYLEPDDTEATFEFLSAQPGEGVAYIPGRIMSKYLKEEEFLQFSSYQYGLVKGQYDVFDYFETQIRKLAADLQ